MGVDNSKAIWEAETEGLSLLEITIGDLLDQQADAFPDVEALVYRYPESRLSTRLTYRQYQAEANRLAKGLMAIGVEAGQHVAVWATNIPEWALLQAAVAKIGAVLVTINTNYRASELEYVLRQGDVSTLFMISVYRDNDFLDAIYTVAPELKLLNDPSSETLHSDKLPELKRVVFIDSTPQPGLISYSRVLEIGNNVSEAELKARQESVSPFDVAQMQFTSGTTGFPKGVQMTHYGMVNNARCSNPRMDFNNGDRLVTPMPFFHVAGSVLGLIGPIAAGATLIPLITFDPAKQLELIEKERATHSAAVPTMFVAMLNLPNFDRYDLSSLRNVGSGGSPVPVSLMEQVNKRMGCEVWIIYGMTESSCSATFSLMTDKPDLKIGTVGIPMANTSVRIVNSQTGETANFGERGELCIRGFQVMKGYYKMPEKTAETIDQEGWLHSGDLATMNERGYINIVGRVKDMVIRGGENIFPAEIEAFLMRHPKVADAQIIGVPDAYMGEEVVALLRLKPYEDSNEDEIRAYCRAGISRQKTPKYFRFVSEFPLTASGKVKKFELREQLIKELGLEEAAKLKMA